MQPGPRDIDCRSRFVTSRVTLASRVPTMAMIRCCSSRGGKAIGISITAFCVTLTMDCEVPLAFGSNESSSGAGQEGRMNESAIDAVVKSSSHHQVRVDERSLRSVVQVEPLRPPPGLQLPPASATPSRPGCLR